MKCDECGKNFDPDTACATDRHLDRRKKLKYGDVCNKCFQKIAKRTAIQVGAGQSTEGTTSEALQMALAL